MYATVTIAVGSFQLITDKNHAQQALIALGKHVCKNGSILIDIFTPDTHGPTRTIRTATINNHTTIRLTTHHVYHEQEKLAEGFCTYELIEYGVIQQKEQEIITVTWYTDAEFEELLNTAGFKLIKIYEESLRPTGPSRIVHARKI